MLKQTEPSKVTIGDIEYAVYPFPAFYAANISGELGKHLGPIVAGVLPLLGDGDKESEDVMGRLFNEGVDYESLMPLIRDAFSSLDGDVMEALLRKLLIVKGNIACQYRNSSGNIEQSTLTESLADEFFCQDITGMFKLALEVIKVNYGSFFELLPDQFGKDGEGIITFQTSKSTEPSTPSSLASLN